MTSSFHSMLHSIFLAMQPDQLGGARLLYPIGDDYPFVKIASNVFDCAVGIPAINIQKDGEKGLVRYGSFIFEDSDFGGALAVRIALATAALLSGKSFLGWFYKDPLSAWLDSKQDSLRASYAANVMLDFLARKRIESEIGANVYQGTVRLADTVAAFLLDFKSANISQAMQSCMASIMLLNSCPGLSRPILAPALDFASKLGQAEKTWVGFHDIWAKTTGLKKKIEDIWPQMAEFADGIYSAAEKIPGVWHQVYLPYSNTLLSGNERSTSIFCTRAKIVTQQEFEDYASTIDGKIDWRNPILNGADSADPAELFFQLAREQKRKDAVQQKLLRACRGLNFNSVGFPVGDYVNYRRLIAELMPQIKSLVSQARMHRTYSSDDQSKESGNVDLPIAVQAVASQQARDDMFFRDDLIEKNESWTILVDSSQSIGSSTESLRALLVCLAEAAKDVLGATNWAIYSFSDRLLCIKDFSEPFGDEVRARIGGLSPSGLSYIPDAIRAAGNLLSQNSMDRNYSILVSDGFATGYPGIEREFSISVTESARRGMDLAAVGLGSAKIKKVVRRSTYVNNPLAVVKEFMKIYSELSAV